MRKEQLIKKVASSFIAVTLAVSTVLAMPGAGNIYAADATFEVVDKSSK